MSSKIAVIGDREAVNRNVPTSVQASSVASRCVASFSASAQSIEATKAEREVNH